MPTDSPERPDPDRLLAELRGEAERARTGKLKVWLGAAPGVGKTFAMLTQAQRLRAQGVDVVVGIVETHGRTETSRMLQGLPELPRRQVEYRGTTLAEFDLDAALARRPAVLLVDELAHTNAPGSRFEKRWQDVRALLDAGISVHTTLNVQHIESLNDVVARLTGVTVRETVPDELLARAEELQLVDLPPDALLERLRAGKIYIPAAAHAAAQSFFQKGNLAALRELALRTTAQLVDRRRREERQSGGERRLRTTGERVLVCVGPSPLSANLVRAAHRMSAVVRGELLAVSVARPGGAGWSAAARERVLQHLRLAETLGASTATLERDDAARAILEFAEHRGISRIVVGKTRRTRLQDALFGSFTMEMIRHSRGIDVYVIDGAADQEKTGDARAAGAASAPRASARDFGVAFGCTCIAVAVAMLAFEPPDLSTEAMLLMLGVVATARWAGRWPALVTALLNALAFNFLMIEPRFTFAVAELSYLLAFGAMAVVGVCIGTLVATTRERAAAAAAREGDITSLLSLTRELADAATAEEVGRITLAHLRDVLRGDLAVLIAPSGQAIERGALVATHGTTDWLDDDALAVARWSHDHGKAAGAGTSELPGTRALFLPLRSRRGKEGVLGVHGGADDVGLTPQQRQLLDTFTEQAAAACERVALAVARARAERDVETERLRSTLLASVSHDLRTPLTTITGAASRLVHEADLAPSARADLAETILAQASRLNDLIANLLFATRLESGAIALRKQWTAIEEVIGAALGRADLRQHRVAVQVPPNLPLLDADPVLLEQAIYNLLDNAGRHTPPGTHVAVRAALRDRAIVVEVADDGPGIPPTLADDVFRRFARSPNSQGLGLGLAICAGIAQAHGGRAWLETGTPRGATFRLRLPLPATQPPAPAAEAEPR